MKIFDICINGAGPVGATLACQLVEAGFSVLLVERVALPDLIGPHLDGRAYALSEGSRRVLQAGGVWEQLPQAAQPIRKISVADGPNLQKSGPSLFNLARATGQSTLVFDATDYPAGAADLTAFGWMVEAHHLRSALNEALAMRRGASLNIAAPHQARCNFTPDEATIALDTGQKYRARLVVAAEGRHSPLRQQARIPLTKLAYRQSGLVSIITHEKPHAGVALERFLPDGPFARLPLTGTNDAPHRSAIVWAAATPRAHFLNALPNDAFLQEINARLDDCVGRATSHGARWIYPLSAQYAHSYFDHRMVLIGDAAHGLHPIAGQGLNLGFRDVRILAEHLINARTAHQDHGALPLLRSYQHHVRSHNMTMLFACDVMERMFAAKNPAMRALRHLGMRALDKATPLRENFIRRTMGLT